MKKFALKIAIIILFVSFHSAMFAQNDKEQEKFILCELRDGM
jgi:hypothetical protein